MDLARRLEWLESFFGEYSTEDGPDEYTLEMGREAGLTEDETAEVWRNVLQGRAPSVESSLTMIGQIDSVGRQKRVRSDED